MKGAKLYFYAQRYAKSLGLNPKRKKLTELIREIQLKEGYSDCFRKKENCQEIDCIWRESCLKK